MLNPKINYFKDPSEIITYMVKSEESGLTLYELLRKKLFISRGFLRTIRGQYRIRLNGSFCDFSTTRVKEGDILEFNFNFEEQVDFSPQQMDLDIIYEDEHLLIINKPPGILVHPTSDERENTLANGVLYYLRNRKNYNLFRPVHRLDRNTSGLIIIAKNLYAHNYLTYQFQKQKIHRQYLAFVHGIVEEDSKTICAPIGRVEGSIIQRKIDFINGKNAVTHFEVIKRYTNSTLVSLTLETGRTHQIRVHLSSSGHPLLGDTLYGGNDNLIKRHALHSHRIKCQVPFSNQWHEFEAPLTPDLENLKNILSSKFNLS